MSAQTQPLGALRPNFDTRDIDKNNPLYVDFGEARSNLLTTIYLALGLQKDKNEQLQSTSVAAATPKKHWVLYGHRGSGKSTELNNIQTALEQSENSGYLPIRIKVEQDLNPGDISFSDIFILILEKVAETFKDEQYQDHSLNPIEQIINILKSEHIVTKEDHQALNLEAAIGVNFLAKMVAQFRNSSVNVASWRTRIKQNFSELVSQFNQIVYHYENLINKKLFIIIDGTDKIGLEDARKLFADSFNPISKIDCYCIYTAPMSLKLTAGLSEPIIFRTFTLPTMKLYESHAQARSKEAYKPHYDILHEFVDKRIPKKYFDRWGNVIDDLITASGGNPAPLG